MKRTGYLHDIRYMLHDTGPYHPEMAERLTAIHQGIEAAGLLERIIPLKAVQADMERITAVHKMSYIRRFEEVCLSGNKSFDHADNQICVETYETAFLAAGGVIDAARRIMEGELDNAFCAVRPPGHHAETFQAMGFCYFNNAAVAARYLQEAHGIKRVGIIDIDVHHGNGTQQIFEEDDTVFYYSVHQHPSFAFPGTGREFEIGTGAGEGFTKNSLALPGNGDTEYVSLIKNDLLPAMAGFEPEFIIVSTGFDGHAEDDMADMTLSTQWYTWIAKILVALADKYAKGRLLSVLEGGYCLERLGELAANHVAVMLEG